MRVGTKRVLGIYLGLYPIDKIYINKDLCYEKQPGEVAYRLSDDRTYYIVLGKGTLPTTNIVISDTYKDKIVKEIRHNAFNGADITSVTIPATITKIGTSAFSSCKSLQTVTYNAKSCQDFSVRDSYPFRASGNNLIVNIGNNVETIPAYMFADSNVVKLVATGTSLSSINDGACMNCRNLSNITLSDTITSIGNSAFSGCTSLTSVTIPENIESIGRYAFTSVSTVYYDGGNVYNLIKGVYEDRNIRFSNDNDVTIYANITNASGYPQVFSDETLIIPYSENYESIDGYGSRGDIKRIIIDPRFEVPVKGGAFASCTNLKEVWIPKSMITTENNWLVSRIQEGAFTKAMNSTGIEKVYFEGSYDDWQIVSRRKTDAYGEYLDEYGIGIPFTATIKYNQPMYKYANIK